jgi:AraC family transcriptional regulator
MERVTDPRIRRTLDLIGQQLHRRLTVPHLARVAGLSVAQFTRLFKQTTGMTPYAFVQQQRMLRARVLVERTNLPVAGIMAQVGISDRSRFAREFRMAHGSTPRTLRTNLRSPRRSG